MREKVMQIQEAQRVPIKMTPKKLTPRHTIIKMTKFKDKERILKAVREKQLVTYQGSPIRLSADLSVETLQAQREWQEIFQVMKITHLYPARFLSKIEGEIRSLQEKKQKRLKTHISTKPAL